MKRILILTALCAAFVPAFAQSSAETNSLSQARTDISNVGSPTITSNTYAPADQTIRQHGLPVSSAASNFVNGPAGDTCAGPGDAASLQTGVFGIAANKGGGMVVPCNDRADALNMRATGEDAVAVTMRHCQNPAKAEAYEDAADLRDLVIADIKDPAARAAAPKSFRCPDRLRPQWATEREGKNRPAAQQRAQAPAAQVTASNTSDPYIRGRLNGQ